MRLPTAAPLLTPVCFTIHLLCSTQGVEIGIIVSVCVSLLLVIYRTAFPRITTLGKLPGTEIYRWVAVLQFVWGRLWKALATVGLAHHHPGQAARHRDLLVGGVVRNPASKRAPSATVRLRTLTLPRPCCAACLVGSSTRMVPGPACLQPALLLRHVRCGQTVDFVIFAPQEHQDVPQRGDAAGHAHAACGRALVRRLASLPAFLPVPSAGRPLSRCGVGAVPCSVPPASTPAHKARVRDATSHPGFLPSLFL